MPITNYHTHCHYCDGQGSPQEMIDRAQQLGFDAIGFSSHAPLPFDNDYCMPADQLSAYVSEIQQLKQHSTIEVYVGLEIDYIAPVITPTQPHWKTLDLDYCIGSVHTLDAPNGDYPALSVDGPIDDFLRLLNEVHQGNAQQMIALYYQRIAELCAEGGFDILGHYDLVKKHNKALAFFDESESWYQELAISTLDAVAKAGVILEVNYGGLLRGATDEVYPSPWLLQQANKKGIPVQINADAHAPHHLGVHHQTCRDILIAAGYTHQRVLLGNRWQDVEL